MPVFEYMVGVNLDELEELNALGVQGWELVAVIATGPNNANNVFWFKREKRQN